MFDSELQRRSALCLWPKVISPDGIIDTYDEKSILGAYPFEIQSSNVEVIRFSLNICSQTDNIIEITRTYRK